jgi:hypothetical protein
MLETIAKIGSEPDRNLMKDRIPRFFGWMLKEQKVVGSFFANHFILFLDALFYFFAPAWAVAT